MEFTSLEQQLIDLSANRYNRWFFRWGHLLGWLAPPVFVITWLPAIRPYRSWLFWLVIVLAFEWYVVVSTRVIGKLKARLDSGETSGGNA